MGSDILTAQPRRRVVTGHDEDGKSMIWLDGRVPESAQRKNPENGIESDVLWASEEVPTPILKNHGPMVEWFSEHEWFPTKGFRAFIATWKPSGSYPMHVSKTFDVIVVISGQLELILEKESTVLNPGDSVIQRETIHAWRVVGDKPCVFVGFLLAKKGGRVDAQGQGQRHRDVL